jgi:tryptophan-rich sensory protein
MKAKYFLTFLFFNFIALAIGVLLMNDGPRTEWYISLNKAPWTPVSWVFGFAWSTIMFCFSFYMTKLSLQFKFLKNEIVLIYSLQWILNVSWNFFFFNKHLVTSGLIIIILLWLLIGYFTFKYLKQLKWNTLFIIPYLIWLTIASSLNAYIVLNN